MKIALNKWFSLPRLGKDVFSDLMRAKVKYDTKLGFQLNSATNVQRALSLLSNALGEEVELSQACFICDNPIDEAENNNNDNSRSICSNCLANSDAYDLYVMKFAKLMETI